MKQFKYFFYSAPPPRAGYTLLELLTVLLIFSLLAGLTVPKLTTMYESMQRVYEQEEIVAQLAGLNYLAFQQGRDIELSTFPPIVIQANAEDDELGASMPQTEKNLQTPPLNSNYLDLPTGWQVKTQSPIIFFTNGACSGGEVVLVYQAEQPLVINLKMNPPFCQPELSQTSNE